MTGIAIYLEGGGQGRDTKRRLRIGMDRFLRELKEQARRKSMHWKVVACGGRDQAFRRWSRGPATARYPVRILLVDAEGPVTGSAVAHLAARDGWTISQADEASVHLMVQTMESWIVADRSALEGYYGPHLLASALPAAANLETVPKDDIQRALEVATRPTGKGEYHKTRHPPGLLGRLDAARVRARCRTCNRLFKVVRDLIEAA